MAYYRFATVPISITFSLMMFRDAWINKSAHKQENLVERLHVVIIEEPEAHLHPQAQQIFINNAFSILTNLPAEYSAANFKTQMIVSTHSSYITYSADFAWLRYFKKEMSECPIITVKSLSSIFGSNEKDNERFVSKYFRVTHCDLLFADAVIIIEGDAERILLPAFIEKEKDCLNLHSRYISILNIGGNYCHIFKPMLEALGIITLTVTDLDAAQKRNKRRPELNKSYNSTNPILNEFLKDDGKPPSLDYLLSEDTKKEIDSAMRIAYQNPVKVHNQEEFIIPSTFEDAIIYENIIFFKDKKKEKYKFTGLLKKLVDNIEFDKTDKNNNKINIQQTSENIFNELKENSKKTEMALDILYTFDLHDLQTPQYIQEGLQWLDKKLNSSYSENL